MLALICRQPIVVSDKHNRSNVQLRTLGREDCGRNGQVDTSLVLITLYMRLITIIKIYLWLTIRDNKASAIEIMFGHPTQRQSKSYDTTQWILLTTKLTLLKIDLYNYNDVNPFLQVIRESFIPRLRLPSLARTITITKTVLTNLPYFLLGEIILCIILILFFLYSNSVIVLPTFRLLAPLSTPNTVGSYSNSLPRLFDSDLSTLGSRLANNLTSFFTQTHNLWKLIVV